MKKSLVATIVFGLTISGAFHGAEATTINGISVDNTFFFLDQRSINDVGLSTTLNLNFGANITGSSAGFSSEGIFTASGSTSPTLTTSLSVCGPTSTAPGFCGQTTPFTSSKLNGTWQLELNSPTNQTALFSLNDTGIPSVPPPFPQNVTIQNSSSGINPTISWTLSSGTNANGLRIQIFDLSTKVANGTPDVIHAVDLAPTATSYQLPTTLSTGQSLIAGHQYSINFLIETFRDPNGPNLSTNFLSRSSSFFDFTPTPGVTTPGNIALPMVDGSTGVYHFNIASVSSDSLTFIDPAVATGFIYKTGMGDPNFATVLLPNLQGSEPYTITWDNGLETEQIFGGDIFNFLTTDPLGVDSFTVTGIDPADGIDPSNTTAFVTGLTFVSTGSFTGTMTPITTDVPEPASITLLGAVLVTFGAIYRRRSGGA